MMEENKAILTDADVDEVLSAIHETNGNNESLDKLREAKEKSVEELLEDAEKTQKNVSVSINPVTGSVEGSCISSPYTDSSATIFEEFDDLKPAKDIDRDYSYSQLSKSYNKLSESTKDTVLTHEQVDQLKKVIIARNEGKHVKYADIPDFLKELVDTETRRHLGRGMRTAAYGAARNAFVTSLLDEITENAMNEKISEVVMDLDTSVKNLVKKEYADVMIQQHKQCVDTFMKKFPELAETKYKDSPEKRDLLMKISAGFEESYSLKGMYERFCNGGKLMKIRHIDIENLHKVIRNFEMKYERSSFVIRDLNTCFDVLRRHVNQRFSDKVIKGFIITFCNYSKNMDANKPEEHTFMYYFINNIKILDVPMVNADDIKFKENFIENINHFLGAIQQRMEK